MGERRSGLTVITEGKSGGRLESVSQNLTQISQDPHRDLIRGSSDCDTDLGCRNFEGDFAEQHEGCV